jgi:outer membrane protein TolC
MNIFPRMGFVIAGSLFLVGALASSIFAAQPLETEDPASSPPTLPLSLREAMQAAVDQNPTVQLFREQVKESEAVAFTELGAMLPHFSGNVTGANRKFFLGNFGGTPAVSDKTPWRLQRSPTWRR